MTLAGLLYLAFFALATSMPRHATALLGQWNRPRVAAALPYAGWALLGVSLVFVLFGGGMTLVCWFGLLPLTAGAVLLCLTFRPRLALALVPLAAILVLV